jgi:hypothetical protein
MAARVIVLFLMSLSVTGFTAAINYCTMNRSSECCCKAEQTECSKTPDSNLSIEEPSASCNIKIVAGGLNPVAQNVPSESVVKTITIDFISLDAGILAIPVVPRIPLLAHANDIAPPSVDIYIRTVNFLI